MLRRIFGPRRDEMMGECRKLHNEELRDLYSSPGISRRRMTWAGHVARMAEEEEEEKKNKKNSYMLLVEKAVRKRPLGRPRHRFFLER
jgi:hypothetical protein